LRTNKNDPSKRRTIDFIEQELTEKTEILNSPFSLLPPVELKPIKVVWREVVRLSTKGFESNVLSFVG
jgi:hypothetical protein